MQPIRIIYDDIPDSIPVPEELRRRKAEVILWPLDEQTTAAEPSGNASSPQRQRQPGSARGKLTIIADDDEHLDDFKDYMP